MLENESERECQARKKKVRATVCSSCAHLVEGSVALTACDRPKRMYEAPIRIGLCFCTLLNCEEMSELEKRKEQNKLCSSHT
jgi:hypothetical protein